MTDELLYAKLAEHVGRTGSPLPVLHGEHVGFLGVVYPILLAPFYGTLDPVGAFEAAHVVNALLFASAAIPAYLLGRRLTTPSRALALAALTVSVPWAVNAAFVMSEPAAYPIFLWALLACHVAVSEPSLRHDALAVGGLALAFFTRPQFLFLAAVLPLAALLVSGPRRAVAAHRALAVAYVLGLLVVVPLAALGEAHRLLGDYGVTATEGSLLPSTVWKSAALHLDVLAVGTGVVPFLLGAGWAYSSLRTEAPRRRALAALAALSLPLLALETASYDVRFGGTGVFRDRYLFYLAPVLLLATAACLEERRRPLLGIVAATAFFAATVALADFQPVAGLWVDSPQSVLNGVIHDDSAGLPAGVFVALCGLLLGAICLGLARVPRGAAAAVVALFVLAFGGSTAGYAFERLLDSNTPAGIPVTGQPRVRDWVDRATSGPVGLLAYPVSRDWANSAVLWWDVEFWNDHVRRAFVIDGTFTYTPFPTRSLQLDFATGRFPGTDAAPPYVLGAAAEHRFALAGSQAAANLGLVLLAADRPYRALWATRGLEVDGWAEPGRPATIRIYAQPDDPTQLVRAAIALNTPAEATAAVSFRLNGTAGSATPGTLATPVAAVCVPRDGHADLTLVSDRAASIGGPPLGPSPGTPRDVGVVVSGVQLDRTGTDCR